MNSIALLPQPRQLEVLSHRYHLAAERFILLDVPQPQHVLFAPRRFQQALTERLRVPWDLIASPATPRDQIGLVLSLQPDRLTRPQSYELTIGSDLISIVAADEAGLFYGVCTLIQLLEAADETGDLPGVHITDWPDFSVRGVMLDISRDKVPTFETTCALIDRLSGWKINQFQLYTEHTFAYLRHPEVWASASPFTGEEILALDAFCRERYVELVPNQNSFGHMHRWLELPRYQALAEAPNGFDFPSEYSGGPFSLNPLDPDSLALVTELYDELLPHFSSRQLNVGCDETFDLGQGRSRAECQRLGTGRVYLNYLRQLYQEVLARDHVMQFWGDIIVQHPDLVPELPHDAIALEWGYEADHPFEAHCAQFAQAGLPFYVCPGTATWNSIGGRTTNALGNLRNAAENGLKLGARGYLNTEWGDNHHWQPRAVNDLGFAMGAACSWAYAANRGVDVPRMIGQFAFDDPTGNLGRVAYDLGEVYRTIGFVPHNSSVLFWMLYQPLADVRGYRETVSEATLREALGAIDQAVAPLAQAQSRRADAALVRREFEYAARLLRLGTQRGLYAIGAPSAWTAAEFNRRLSEAASEFEQVWVLRNRLGGLRDSLARFKQIAL